MPEACFLCLDSTEFMRNGDQFPNRFFVVQEAANLLFNAKIQMNAENTVGFLTLGGNACTVFETLTLDVDRVMTSLSKILISGKKCHFSQGLQIASLALSHRTNPRAEKRIVAFIGTPLTETDEELDKLARKLRKDDVAVDIVAVGVEGNVPRLTAFVEKLSKQGNSRFLHIPVGISLTDALISHPIMLGAHHGDAGPDSQGAFGGFGVDPSTDPELALAIRMSLEEQQRQAEATLAAQSAASHSEIAGGAMTVQPEDLENMSEEEMLARALRMSLEEAQRAQQSAEVKAEEDNDSFFRDVERELEGQQQPSQGGGDEHHMNEEKEHKKK